MTSKLFFNLSRTVFVERMMHPWRPRGRIVGARESLNGWKNKAQKKSKEWPEEALGTMSYQTSSKRSPPFWLLIGARKTQVFWHQSEARMAVTVWNWSGRTLSPGALLAVLYFSSFRLSLAPFICPWVSEDGPVSETYVFTNKKNNHFLKFILSIR